jgi:hypothetical protein
MAYYQKLESNIFNEKIFMKGVPPSGTRKEY